MTDATSPALLPTSARLTIRAIELTAITVPLGREYRGSYYRMNDRSTIVVRLLTDEGVVGEAYAGDEGATLGAIQSVITDEIAPRLIGENAFAYERCWQLGHR